MNASSCSEFMGLPDTRFQRLPLRYQVVESDRDHVRRIVEATGFFHAHEVDVAVELVDDRLRKGDASGYWFVFVEHEGQPVAYSCYGPIACTVGSFDVFWIAVDPAFQGAGIGRALLRQTEVMIQSAGGRRIYVETSGRPQYQPTREFYARCGYSLVAELPDFYDAGDSKLVLVKRLESACEVPSTRQTAVRGDGYSDLGRPN
jgi:ribosomal protein S18 acetylase RimI-like enzyme